MPELCCINYTGLKPTTAYEELIHFVDYSVKYLDRTATWTRDSPLLTQLDGIGMMEMERTGET